MREMRRTYHDLGGHTADVDAGTAHRAALDERDLGTAFSRGDGCRHRATTRAEDGDVERGRAGVGLARSTPYSQYLAEQRPGGGFLAAGVLGGKSFYSVLLRHRL